MGNLWFPVLNSHKTYISLLFKKSRYSYTFLKFQILKDQFGFKMDKKKEAQGTIHPGTVIQTILCRQICLVVVFVVVDCGLTSHSAIFQLYSDGTDVQFPNFDLLPGTHAIGS